MASPRPGFRLLVAATLTCAVAGAGRVGAADAPPEPAGTPAASTAPAAPAVGATVATASAAPPNADELYALGKSLFDQYAPPEIKEEYEFPSREQWDEFAAKLQRALDGDSPAELAAYEPQARAALTALRAIPGYDDYADWLEEQIDLIEAAKQAAPTMQPAPVAPEPAPVPAPAPRPAVPPSRPTPAPAVRRVEVPYYDLWLARVRQRPTPPAAAGVLPEVRAGFAAEGVPVELAWLAEVESSFNPRARSPSGAEGLFQLTPETARRFGLSTWLPDERTNPAKNARAAARLLRALHDRFGDWPLAIAAYNAGEGRVSRALTARHGGTFAEVAPALPVGTRLYVPQVLATVAVRTGVTPEKLATGAD